MKTGIAFWYAPVAARIKICLIKGKPSALYASGKDALNGRDLKGMGDPLVFERIALEKSWNMLQAPDGAGGQEQGKCSRINAVQKCIG